jgi:hypothetical protein
MVRSCSSGEGSGRGRWQYQRLTHVPQFRKLPLPDTDPLLIPLVHFDLVVIGMPNYYQIREGKGSAGVVGWNSRLIHNSDYLRRGIWVHERSR